MMLAGQTGGRRSGCRILMGPTRNRLGMASRTRHLPAAEISMLLGRLRMQTERKRYLRAS
jgi:hypothetical protein